MRSTIRWSRIWIGLVLVLAAVLLLVIENRAGVVTQPYPATPTPLTSVSAPAVGTPQTAGGLRVNVKLYPRVAHVAGLPAQPSTDYQAIAVLIVNHDKGQVRVAAAQFTLRFGTRTVRCLPLPGEPWRPADPGIKSGETVEAIAVAPVPGSVQGGEVVFTLPGALRGGSLIWQMS